MDKPGLSNFESPLHSNFIYGRAAERSASSLGRHGSTAIRPVGFYYEDEAPYESSEVKTMFVGGSNTSPDEIETAESSGVEDSQRYSPKDTSETANLHPRSSTHQDSGATLEQRLAHMRQHIYQPGTHHQHNLR
jgi:hypothetical protein